MIEVTEERTVKRWPQARMFGATAFSPMLAVVPLTLLSVAGTVGLTAHETPTTTPPGSILATAATSSSVATSVDAAAQAPATAISVPPVVSASTALGATAPTVLPVLAERASAGAIPDVALAAYQRAESVIDAADPSCHLSWQLIAAVGRVESDHGRTNGHTLDSDGRDTPALEGPRLDGTHHTTRIPDTDAGQYDGDRRFDHAVGPMQFLPATWAVTGVDADGDGVRDPQDINDAALATAVYLCAGPGDLAYDAGQRLAVHRYNHSTSYVDTVLSVMRGYLAGGFGVLPVTTVDAGYVARSDATSPDLTVGGVVVTATAAWVAGSPAAVDADGTGSAGPGSTPGVAHGSTGVGTLSAVRHVADEGLGVPMTSVGSSPVPTSSTAPTVGSTPASGSGPTGQAGDGGPPTPPTPGDAGDPADVCPTADETSSADTDAPEPSTGQTGQTGQPVQPASDSPDPTDPADPTDTPDPTDTDPGACPDPDATDAPPGGPAPGPSTPSGVTADPARADD